VNRILFLLAGITAILLFFLESISATDIKFNWPVATTTNVTISSTFGESRIDHFHNGLDIPGKQIPVQTMGSGTILWKTEARNLPGEIPFGGGKTIVIDHGDYWTGYMHLSSINENISITDETILGRSGDTGHSGGAHLHFFIYSPVQQKMYNPLLFLPGSPFYKNIAAPQIKEYAIQLPDKIAQVTFKDEITMSLEYPVLGSIVNSSSSNKERWGVYRLQTYLSDNEDIPVQDLVFNFIKYQDKRWVTSNNKSFEEVYNGQYYILGTGFKRSKEIIIKTSGYNGPESREKVELKIKE